MAATPRKVTHRVAARRRLVGLVVTVLAGFFSTAGTVAHADPFWAGTIDSTYISHSVDPGDPRFGWLDPKVTVDSRREVHVTLDRPGGIDAWSSGDGHGSVTVESRKDYGIPAFPCIVPPIEQPSSVRTDVGSAEFDKVDFEIASPANDEPGGEYWIFTRDSSQLTIPTTFTDTLCGGSSGDSYTPPGSVFATVPGKQSDSAIDAIYTFAPEPTELGWETRTIEIHLKRSVSLVVSRTGTGSGTVKGGTIDCGIHCADFFPLGANVSLTATPTPGSVFDHWEGACTGHGPCSVTMNQSKAVVAVFALAPILTVKLMGAGTGVVRGDGIDCGLTCSHSYLPGTNVRLTPTAAAGSVFDHWEHACTGAANCAPTMDEDKAVTAVFALARRCYHTAAAFDAFQNQSTVVEGSHTTSVHWCVESDSIDLTGPVFTDMALDDSFRVPLRAAIGLSSKTNGDWQPPEVTGEGTGTVVIHTYPQFQMCIDWAKVASLIPAWKFIGSKAWKVLPAAARKKILSEGIVFLVAYLKYTGFELLGKQLLSKLFATAEHFLLKNVLPTVCDSARATVTLRLDADGNVDGSVVDEPGYDWKRSGIDSDAVKPRAAALARPDGTILAVATVPYAGTIVARAARIGRGRSAHASRSIRAVVARGRTRTRRAGLVRIVLRPTRVGRHLLKRHRGVRVQLRLRFSPVLGKAKVTRISADFGLPRRLGRSKR